GTLCESQVILEYLEDAYPQVPLLPPEPFERAKVRELTAFVEIHVELVARRVYSQAFFGGTVSQGAIDATRRDLERGIAGFARLAKFAPFVAGERFSMADCAAGVHLPVISMASRAIWGEDLLAGLPVRDYAKRLGERPAMQKVSADRKANTELMAKLRAKEPAFAGRAVSPRRARTRRVRRRAQCCARASAPRARCARGRAKRVPGPVRLPRLDRGRRRGRRGAPRCRPADARPRRAAVRSSR